MNKDRLDLESISDCLERIAEYSAAGEASFMASRLIQDGVNRNLEVIGKATKNLTPELREASPEIPWRQIAGMREPSTTHGNTAGQILALLRSHRSEWRQRYQLQRPVDLVHLRERNAD